MNRPFRRPQPLISFACALLAISLGAGAALADVVNSSLAEGSYEGQKIFSRPTLGSVPLARPVAAFALDYTGAVAQDSPQTAAGDRVDLLLAASNTGNVSLYGFRLQSGGVSLVLAEGDANANLVLDVGETWRFRGEYPLTQADLDGDPSSDALSFRAELGFDGLAPQSATASIPLQKTPSLEITGRLLRLTSPLPLRFIADVEIGAVNPGNVTLRDMSLRAGFETDSAQILSTQIVSVTGFGAGPNTDFNAVGENELMAPGALLSPGKSGTVRLRVEARTQARQSEAALTAHATSPQLGADEVAGLVALPFADSDADGAPDAIESMSGDRDGDGIVDAADYDPTGYFYCESDGRIMQGGRIAVEHMGTGQRVADVGQEGPITVLRDGSDGAYQFHVTEGGRYRLSYALPEPERPGSRRPQDRAADTGGALLVLGAGESGDSGFISNRSENANPWRLEFDLEPGDPVVFNNNIPSSLCGTPALEAKIVVSDGPIVLRSGRTRLAYRITVENTGSEALAALRLDNDLTEAFEAGGFEVETVLLEDAPHQFGAEANPFFDGTGDTGMLTSGGALRPGERVSLIEVVAFRARGGEYANTVTASGVSVVDFTPVEESSASTEIVVAGNTGPAELVAGIDTATTSVAAGQDLQVAFSIANPQSVMRQSVDIVGRLPSGISYVAGSAQIDGTEVEPTIAGEEILWPDRSVPAGGSVTVEAKLTMDEEATWSDAIMQLIARENGSGRILSSPARLAISAADPDAPCIEAMGAIYLDANLDGIRQPHEEGISDIRVLFGDGTATVSDRSGHYTMPCGFFDAPGAATEISVRVDPVSLLENFSGTVTPQSAAIGAGTDKLPDFAVRPTADIALRLDERNFLPASAELTQETLAQISRLLREFPGGDANARITYAAGLDDRFAEQRLDLAAQLMVEAWNLIHSNSGLSLETELVEGE